MTTTSVDSSIIARHGRPTLSTTPYYSASPQTHCYPRATTRGSFALPRLPCVPRKSSSLLLPQFPAPAGVSLGLRMFMLGGHGSHMGLISGTLSGLGRHPAAALAALLAALPGDLATERTLELTLVLLERRGFESVAGGLNLVVA